MGMGENEANLYFNLSKWDKHEKSVGLQSLVIRRSTINPSIEMSAKSLLIDGEWEIKLCSI